MSKVVVSLSHDFFKNGTSNFFGNILKLEVSIEYSEGSIATNMNLALLTEADQLAFFIMFCPRA